MKSKISWGMSPYVPHPLARALYAISHVHTGTPFSKILDLPLAEGHVANGVFVIAGQPLTLFQTSFVVSVVFLDVEE